MLDKEELDHDEDYKRIVKAVIDSSITDYVKLAHPKNRNKKYLEQTFLNAIEVFFDDSYKFEAFVSIVDQLPLSTKDLISIMISNSGVSMDKTRQHVINESIKYWWEKNFNDISIPSSINIFGKVYFIHNASTEHIDLDKNKIFLPIKKTGSDRIFFKLCLKVILIESGIELEEETFNKLHKVFYLFLKINNAF
jgi:hypothetical protein